MANQYERAFRAWPILTNCANSKNTITYGELADELGIHYRVVRFVLGKIQDYCLEQRLPPLTILVVNQTTLQPSDGFIAWDAGDIPEGQNLVFNFPWNTIANPYQFAEDGSHYDDLVSRLKKSPDSSKEIYTKVKVRGLVQQIFRSSLRQIYRDKCAFTKASFTMCLDAAHIIPWSQSIPEQRLDVRNGILMSSFHHRLFDQKLLTIDNEYRIRFYDPKMKDGPYTKYDKLLTVNLHGKKMHLPFQKKHRPNTDLINERNKTLDWI